VTEEAREHGGGAGGTNARDAAWLAWSLWALAVALTALSLVFMVWSLSRPNVHVFDWWLGNALVVVDATVGALIASRRPENPVGWLMCLSAVAVGTSSFASQYAIYALLARPGALPAGAALAWVASWTLPAMIGTAVFYTLLFPTGRLPSSRWRIVAWLTAAFVVAGTITSSLSPDAYLGSLGPIRNPLGIEAFSGIYKAVLFTMSPLLHVAAVVSVFARLRRATGTERQQIKWFAYASAVLALGIAFNVVNLAVDTPTWLERTGPMVFTIAGAMVPVSIGVAILRYRLYDIDIIINRTLVYGSLTVALALVYFGGVTLLQGVLRATTGQESTLAVVASTLAIAALFGPLRRRVQAFVDRRFYRRKYDAAKTLDAFSVRLRDETRLDALGDDLVGVVTRTVQPAHASLWLRPEAGSKREQAD
jgi:hypothetical protein